MLTNLGFALQGAWKVLLAGLLLGAGLPLLFALGIRSLAWGAGGDAGVHEPGMAGPKAQPIGALLAYALFATVVLAVLLGVTFIVASGFGKTLSFEDIFPSIVDK
jgi:hypothetical protein